MNKEFEAGLPEASCGSCEVFDRCLISNLPSELQDLVKSEKEVHVVQRKDTLFREGMGAADLAIVQDGWFGLKKRTKGGSEVLISFVFPGQTIGLESAVDNKVYHSTSLAFADSRVCVIKKEVIFEMMTMDSQFPHVLISEFCSVLENAFDRVVQLSTGNARQRIATSLVVVGQRFESFELPRELLASKCGTSRETVARTLSSFRKMGLISIDGRNIRILDLLGLDRLANP